MGPNSAQAVRLFTREKGGAVSDVTLEKGTDFQVIVQAEAGSAALSNGVQYQIGLLIKDLTDNTTIPFALAPVPVGQPAQQSAGTIGKPEWQEAAHEFVYQVAETDLKNRGGHFVQAYAFLLVGLKDFDASSVTSELALVLP